MSVKSGKQPTSKVDKVATYHSPKVEHDDTFSISKEVWNGTESQDLLSLNGRDQQEREMELFGLESKIQNSVKENSVGTEMLLMDGIGLENEKMNEVTRNFRENKVMKEEGEVKKCIDPLLSRDAHLSDILGSLSIAENLVSSKPDNDLLSMKSQLPAASLGHERVAETNLIVSSQMGGSQVGHLYPQLVGAPLSSQSTVPLQLGRGCDEPFSFISLSSEEKNKDAFNFVQEAMKSSKR